MSFISNLILFSPLLFIAFVVLVVLDRAESLRKGAGLVQPESTRGVIPDTDNPTEENSGDADGRENQTEGEADDGGEGARSPISVTSGDEGFQMVRTEGEEEEETEDEEDEEEDDFEFVEHGGDNNPDDDPGAAGPSNTGGAGGGAQQQQQQQGPRPTPRTKNVGAKKAASLARRDQRRAYHEFQRSRALAAAEQARIEEEARADEIFAERQRRALAEEEIAARREKERLARLEREKEVERVAREDLVRLRRMVGGAGSNGKKIWKVDVLAGDLKRSVKWVVEGLEREGLLGVRGCEGGEGEGSEWEMRMITGKGYYVVVREGEVRRLFERLGESGEKGMSWTEMGSRLEEILELE